MVAYLAQTEEICLVFSNRYVFLHHSLCVMMMMMTELYRNWNKKIKPIWALKKVFSGGFFFNF